MGLEFLNRVRRTTLIAGAVMAVVVATYVGPLDGLGLAAGALWSLANLFLIERLVVALTGRDRGTPATVKAAGWTLAGMTVLFAGGAWLLTRLPIPAQLWGFGLPFAVLTLKAASSLLLGSQLWRRTVASPWRAAMVVAVVLVAAWWIVPAALQGSAEAETGAATTTAPAGDHAATTADPHAAPSDAHGAEGEHAAGAGDHGAAAGGHGESKGPQKFANVITVLSRALPNAGWAQFLHHYEQVFFALVVAAFLCVVAFLSSRNPKMIPGKLQNLVEMLVEGLYNFIAGIIGEKHAARFVPFLGTLGLYIWVMNLSGLIPGFEAPTTSLNVTFALGLIVFLYAQWIGLRGLGLVGYVDHLLGQPRDLTGWMLAPLMLPIHILGELAKPISLSCRLFGNIFGEDMLLVAFVSLGITAMAFLPDWAPGLPLQLPFLFLALLTSTLQAAVFMVLSTIYFLLMLPHDDHGHEHEAQHAHSH